jgi:hypothetical protein
VALPTTRPIETVAASMAIPSPTGAPRPTGAPPTAVPAVTAPPEVSPVAWSQSAIVVGLAFGLFGVSGVALLALCRGRRAR